MSRWVFSSVAALVLIGCTVQGEYACSDASMCVVGGVAGQCEPTGFCSFPDTGCPSGQRYGEFAGAGLAYDCVPAGAAETESGSGAATGSSSTTGPSTTTLTTSTDSSASGVTTAVTTVTTADETGPISGGESSSSGMSGGSTGMLSETSASESESESESESGMIEAPPCADYNFEDAMQVGAMLPDITVFEDDFRQSCLQGNHADVVFYWVAPAAGMYEFYADVDSSLGIDVIGSLWDGCDGEELVCDDDGGDVIDSRIVVDAAAGEAFLWVVNAYGTVSAGFEISISPI